MNGMRGRGGGFRFENKSTTRDLSSSNIQLGSRSPFPVAAPMSTSKSQTLSRSMSSISSLMTTPTRTSVKETSNVKLAGIKSKALSPFKK